MHYQPTDVSANSTYLILANYSMLTPALEPLFFISLAPDYWLITSYWTTSAGL